MFRGYDSGQVLREHIIERVKYLQKELGIIDSSERASIQTVSNE
jgi:hypothetical protein